MQILMRRLVTSRLIRIYTVCTGICFGLTERDNLGSQTVLRQDLSETKLYDDSGELQYVSKSIVGDTDFSDKSKRLLKHECFAVKCMHGC